MISWLRAAYRRQLERGLAALGYSNIAKVSATPNQQKTTQQTPLRAPTKTDATALAQAIHAARSRKRLSILVRDFNSIVPPANTDVQAGWQIKQGRFLVEFPKTPMARQMQEKNFEVIGEGSKAILILPCVWLEGKIVQRGLISYE